MRTALYRLFSEAETLLYVGISNQPEQRWLQHSGRKEWWPSVALYKVEWFENREDAQAAEVDAIRAERPVYNLKDSPWRAVLNKDGGLDVVAKHSMRVQGRSIRIHDSEWQDLEAATATAGLDRSKLINQLLSCWLLRPGAELPERLLPEQIDAIVQARLGREAEKASAGK